MRSRFDRMVVAALCCLLAACESDRFEGAAEGSVAASVSSSRSQKSDGSLALRDTSIAIGDTSSLIVDVKDRFGRSITRFVRVRYYSGDTTVASVTRRGLVTRRAAGLTWLHASAGNGFRDSVAIGRLTASIGMDGIANTPATLDTVRSMPGTPQRAPDSPSAQPPSAVPNAPQAVPPAPTVPQALPPVPVPPPDLSTPSDTAGFVPTQATLPQRFVTHDRPASARRIILRQGDDLQAALDSARRGDEIVLARGTTFNGGFTLRRKSGAGWIVLRGETDPSTAGVRPQPAQFASAAKLVTSRNGVPVLDAEAGASGYWITGIEVAAAPQVTTMGSLIYLSPAGGVAANVPSRIVLERLYVHGHEQMNIQRCVHFDATDAAVVDSWISECHYRGLDSQAILVITSPGRLLFRNNFLSGAGENLMIGGGGPNVAGMLPEDVEIVGNHFYKPLAWQRAGWTVKNLLEIKIGRRIDIRDNYLENNWVMGQIGFAVVIKASDQDAASWVRTSDIVFRRNIVSGSAAGINIFEDGPVGTNRVAILANQFSNVGLTSLGGVGRMLQFVGRLTDIEVRHNTMVFGQAGRTAGSAIMMDGSGSERISIVNNVFEGGEYGFILSGGGTGLSGVQRYAASSAVVGNAISLQSGSGYGAQNMVVPTVAGFGFADVERGDFRLVSTSRLRNSGAHGATPGVPVGAISNAAAARSPQ
jgi:hypothetical protein